jgi:hypothetical protein
VHDGEEGAVGCLFGEGGTLAFRLKTGEFMFHFGEAHNSRALWPQPPLKGEVAY